MSKWIKDFNPQPLIDRLNKTRAINQNGNVQFSGFDLLVNLAHIDSMLELSIDVPDYEKRGLIKSAIFKAGKQNITKKSLLKELNLLERQYYTVEEVKYYLRTSISINRYRRELNHKRIGDVYLSFPKELPKPFYESRKSVDFFRHIEKIDYPKDYMIARVCVKATSVQQASNKALLGLNLYRAYLNYANNLHHSYSFSVGSRRKPINQILLGPIHTLHKENGQLATEEFWAEEDYREPRKTFDPPVVGEYEKKIQLAHDFIKKSKKLPYKEIFEDALLRYNDALDSYDWNNSFVKLWGVLEFLTDTLKDSYKTTIKRAAFIYKDYEVAKQSLEILRNYRNSVIHKGFAVGDIQVFIYDLKGYVEQLLFFLLNNKYAFSDLEEAAYFLDHPREKNLLNYRFKLLSNVKKFLNI